MNAFVGCADDISHQRIAAKCQELCAAAASLTALLLLDNFSPCCWYFDAWTAADVSSNNKQNVFGWSFSAAEHWTAPRSSLFVLNNQMNIFCCLVLSTAPFCEREWRRRDENMWEIDHKLPIGTRRDGSRWLFNNYFSVKWLSLPYREQYNKTGLYERFLIDKREYTQFSSAVMLSLSVSIHAWAGSNQLL